MTEVTQIHKADKPARAPHTILMADVMGRLALHPKLDALVVCWAIPSKEQGTAVVGSACLGTDVTTYFLASRFCHRIIEGQMNKKPIPTE